MREVELSQRGQNRADESLIRRLVGMLPSHEASAPESRCVGKERIEVKRPGANTIRWRKAVEMFT